jgi:hypothetical protein
VIGESEQRKDFGQLDNICATWQRYDVKARVRRVVRIRRRVDVPALEVVWARQVVTGSFGKLSDKHLENMFTWVWKAAIG